MLHSMMFGDGEGNHDHLMHFTKAMTGSSFFAPHWILCCNSTNKLSISAPIQHQLNALTLTPKCVFINAQGAIFDIELPLLGSEIDKGAHQILLITAGQVHSPQGLAWRRKVG